MNHTKACRKAQKLPHRTLTSNLTILVAQKKLAMTRPAAKWITDTNLKNVRWAKVSQESEFNPRHIK